MDLGRIKARGISTTRKAWLTNPLRSLVWRLLVPYFEGTSVEIDQRLQAFAAEDGQRFQRETEIDQQRETEIDQRWQTELANLRTEMGGTRKDIMAAAHRLAGLEDEAAENEKRVEDVIARLSAFDQRFDSLEQDIRGSVQMLGERVDQVNTSFASLRHDVDASVQMLGERVDQVNPSFASLRHDVHASVQMLGERIDTLVRGRSLHPGDRVTLGQGNLLLVPYVSGTHLLVRQHDHIGRRVADGQEWEPHVRVAIEQVSRSGSVAIDVGAYIGIHTITMSRCFDSVYAFEPQRGVYHLLCGNLALNGCTNVIARNLALYDQPGSMRLAPAEWQEVAVPLVDGQPDYDHISNAAALTFAPIDGQLEEVRAITIDALCLNEVAIIKVDAQGADLRVLQGAEQTIRRCGPTVLFEWERDLGARHGASLEKFHSFFAALGYDVTIIQETSPGRQADYLATPR